MPVPLLKHHFCTRSDGGPKAHAHAAYQSGTKLDNGYGRTADFTPKGGILHAVVWVPKDAPSWAKDRGELWRRLEAREDQSTRPNQAILAHKFIGALPCELTLDENLLFAQDFIREQFTRRGYAADWAIHAPDPGSDQRNYHIHIMVPLRRFEKGTWAKLKDRFPKNSPALSHYTQGKQEAFFELQNRYLQKKGIDARIVRQDGKWTVVDHNGVATKYSPAIHREGSTRAWVAPKYTSAPALGGSSNNKAQPHQTTGTASGKYAALAIRPRKGWPEKARIDWETWGHLNPPRFFALWPELSKGSSPGSGP